MADDPIFLQGSIYTLNAPFAGDAVNTRTASKINMTSIHIRGHIHPLFPSVPTEARVIIFYDKQCNGALPPILRSASGQNAIIDDTLLPVDNTVHAPLAWISKQRYKVLWDKTYRMLCYNDTSTTCEPIVINKYIKLGRTVSYNGLNTGTVQDILSNGLFMITLSNIPSPNLTAPQLWFVSEVRFKDA